MTNRRRALLSLPRRWLAGRLDRWRRLLDGSEKATKLPTSAAPPLTPKSVRRTSSLLDEARDFVLICGSYPAAEKPYGGGFIRTRVEAYLESGLRGMVIELRGQQQAPSVDRLNGVRVLRWPSAKLGMIVSELTKRRMKVLVHSPTPAAQEAISAAGIANRLVYWFHGFEVRDYRRLYFNYTTQEMAVLRKSLDDLNGKRMRAATASFESSSIPKVFVSRFLEALAERDVGARATNAHVIPNFIDGVRFAATPRAPEHAGKILLLRPFIRRSYGGDIALAALTILAAQPGFASLSITLAGFGGDFSSAVAPLRRLTNVRVEEGCRSPDEMARLFEAHGIFLAPSRMDSHPVTMGEAMASGLVCVTHAVGGIPEFIDCRSGVLVRPGDPWAYAEALWSLVRNPERLPGLSAAAAARVRAQCGYDQTIAREMELIGCRSMRSPSHAG